MIEIVPTIFNVFMAPFEKAALHKRRKELITQAHGNVLEIGAGTGVNFNYYKSKSISQFTILDLKFNNLIKNHPFNKTMKIKYVEGDAECLPFEDNTFDGVVSTLTYCSVSDPNKALIEVYRVLKRGGKVYFIEHVIPEDRICKRLANNLNVAWNKVCKCNLNRDTLKNIKSAGFKVDGYERFGKGCLIFIKGIGIKE